MASAAADRREPMPAKPTNGEKTKTPTNGRKTKDDAESSGPKGVRRRKKATPEAASRGLTSKQVAQGNPPVAVQRLAEAIEQDGGSVLCVFLDPLGGNWQVLAALPLEIVRPTPFQRDLSDPHAQRLATAIGGLDRYLDPVIAVRAEEGVYWTPNGLHRRHSKPFPSIQSPKTG